MQLVRQFKLSAEYVSQSVENPWRINQFRRFGDQNFQHYLLYSFGTLYGSVLQSVVHPPIKMRIHRADFLTYLCGFFKNLAATTTRASFFLEKIKN